MSYSVKAEIIRFIRKAIQSINKLTADTLVREAAINPFLVKALGIRDFGSLARFYVYQRVGRSLVTSFGTTIEKVIRALAGGRKAGWWDVVANIRGTTYYMSVKSGPRDMDKDQVQHFASRAKDLLRREPGALPVIAMGYGKEPMGPISPTLRDEGLDPEKHTLTGKGLYEAITGQRESYKRLLELMSDVAEDVLGGTRIIELIEDRVEEIAEEFRRRYRTVDDLLLDTF
ncbi:MAG: hypothetical protein DRK00_08370 [Thermoprotei archaeon]|nr:MAG: hypothetical protein DRK00_08370 [Thermoprotei archaeon]